jgi:hypothetical protein
MRCDESVLGFGQARDSVYSEVNRVVESTVRGTYWKKDG